MEESITTYRYVIDPLKVANSSNVLEQPQKIKIVFMKKLRSHWTQGIFPIILCRIFFLHFVIGARGGAVRWGTRLQAGRPWVRFPMVSLEFFIDVIFRPHYGPGVDSTSNRNEYQGYFLGRWGGKGGRCIGLANLLPPRADWLEIWEREPPGTLSACPGLYRNCVTFTRYNYILQFC
jgi:hypothetical protein